MVTYLLHEGSRILSHGGQNRNEQSVICNSTEKESDVQALRRLSF